MDGRMKKREKDEITSLFIKHLLCARLLGILLSSWGTRSVCREAGSEPDALGTYKWTSLVWGTDLEGF